jgi:hypothetical protein
VKTKKLDMKFFSTKIQKLSDNITPFGGISYVNDEFTRSGLSGLIDKELGIRSHKAGYQYSDIFRGWLDLFFCGGDCAEDIKLHFGAHLKQIPGNAVPSPDTLLRGVQELSAENTEAVSTSGQIYQFNINDKMNGLNIKSLLLTGQLEPGQSYDFDYDNQILSHNKYDARPTYKKTKGYFPGIATIGNKTVYIENRDGNANVKMSQSETLTGAYLLLETHGIKVHRSRMDAGSYSEDIINTVSQHSELFYIRANKCQNLTGRICEITDWKKVEINFRDYQVASLDFTQFFEKRHYRLVVMREANRDGQSDLFTGDRFIYRCILTNDRDSTEKEVIEYYNARGSSEKTFDIQNNDFGWSHLPCSDMKHNTVYLILTAIIKNFYNYIAGKVSEVFTDILPSSRIKRFIFRFICVSGRWINKSRQWILYLYTDRPYEKLFTG